MLAAAVVERSERGVMQQVARRGERPHVMVFDSAQLMRDLMGELLQEARCHITVSTFLPGSFDQIAGLQPALLLIDLAIHEQVGWALLERLALDALTRRIPVLVTSTDPRLLERAEAEQVRYGGDGWVVKPFDLEELLADVERLIALP
jgi:two-component system chemotaxis response regulator CheY